MPAHERNNAMTTMFFVIDPYCRAHGGKTESRSATGGENVASTPIAYAPGSASGLQDRFTSIAITDTNSIGNIENEYLPVADLSGICGCCNRRDHLFGPRVVHEQLELNLGNQVDLVLGAAIDLGVP